MEFDPLNPPVEPKAGKIGVASVAIFGVFSILVVFVAAYMWTNADRQLAAAIGMASIIIPVTVGYFVSELSHQRAGAFWFVMTAAALSGALMAWSFNERDDFRDRMDLIAPGAETVLDAVEEPSEPDDTVATARLLPNDT